MDPNTINALKSVDALLINATDILRTIGDTFTDYSSEIQEVLDDVEDEIREEIDPLLEDIGDFKINLVRFCPRDTI